MNTLAILFSGQGSTLSSLIETLHKQGFEVLVALTNNPKAKGIDIAKKHGIPIEIIDNKDYKERESFDTRVIEVLKHYQPKLTVLAGFMRILSPIFTNEIKAINLHPSLLPRHKGLHAIEKSYADEFSHGGVSVHYVDSTLDGGELILQKSLSKKNLDFEEYQHQIKVLEKETLIQAIRTLFMENKENNATN